MRIAPPLPVWIFLGMIGLAHAQKQEEGLLERVTGMPDMELASPMQTKVFEGGGNLKIKEALGVDHQMRDTKTFLSQDYRETRSFLGIKNPWFGSKVMTTKSADLASPAIPNADKAYATTEALTKTAFDAGRSAEQPSSEVATRPYPGRGGAQGALDPFSETTKKTLTVEEVRELLNKND